MSAGEKKSSGWLRNFNLQECPQLRADLEPVHFFSQQGEKYFGLADPFDLSVEQVAMPADLFYTLQFMDGAHSLATIQAFYTQKFNQPLPDERLHHLIEKLKSVYLLENEKTELQLQYMLQEFRLEPVRKMHFAGEAYPASATAFTELWQKYPAQATDYKSLQKEHSIRAMVAPHVDIQLGAETYAKSYHALAYTPPADLFIILGISHLPMQNAFALTTKNFATPNGELQTDVAFVEQLAQNCKSNFFADELHHKVEHSVEFQSSCLSHFAKHEFNIVPILCAFSYQNRSPIHYQIKDLTLALANLIQQSEKKICVIAGVDFSHIGPRYGDAKSPDTYLLNDVEKFDQQLCDALIAGDAEALLKKLKSTNNQYNVCGFAALFTLLTILPNLQGHLLHYNNAIMDEKRSTVTFTSMIFS